MQLERETLVEIGVSVASVGLFVAVIAYIGATHGGERFPPSGAILLVAAVFGFVVLMTIVGIFLDRR